MGARVESVYVSTIVIQFLFDVNYNLISIYAISHYRPNKMPKSLRVMKLHCSKLEELIMDERSVKRAKYRECPESKKTMKLHNGSTLIIEEMFEEYLNTAVEERAFRKLLVHKTQVFSMRDHWTNNPQLYKKSQNVLYHAIHFGLRIHSMNDMYLFVNTVGCCIKMNYTCLMDDNNAILNSTSSQLQYNQSNIVSNTPKSSIANNDSLDCIQEEDIENITNLSHSISEDGLMSLVDTSDDDADDQSLWVVGDRAHYAASDNKKSRLPLKRPSLVAIPKCIEIPNLLPRDISATESAYYTNYVYHYPQEHVVGCRPRMLESDAKFCISNLTTLVSDGTSNNTFLIKRKEMSVSTTTKIDNDTKNKSNIDVSSKYVPRRNNNASIQPINIVNSNKRMNQVSNSEHDAKRTKVAIVNSINERDNNDSVGTVSNNIVVSSSNSNEQQNNENLNTSTFVSSSSSLSVVVDNTAISSSGSNELFFQFFRHDVRKSPHSKNRRRILSNERNTQSKVLEDTLFANKFISYLICDHRKVNVYDEHRKRQLTSDKIRCCGQIRLGSGDDPLTDIRWEVTFTGINHVMITDTHTIIHILNCDGSIRNSVFRIPHIYSEELYSPTNTM